MGGILVALAPLLLGALIILLPRDRRPLLRLPLAVFGLVLVLIALAWLLPPHWATRGIFVVGFGCLLLVIVRALLLFLTETRIGRALIPPLPKIVTDVVQGLLYLAAAMLTLHAAGMEPGSLLTTSALLTAVLGLALQDTLGNLFSGLALQLGRPFDVGDWVEIDQNPSHAGRVVEVGWRATKILTLDDVEVIIPNGFMAKALLRNATRPTPVARRNIAFTAAYDDPPADVVAAALSAVVGIDGVLSHPAPSVILVDYADSAIAYSLRYYTDDVPGASVLDSQVRTRLWYAFRRRGVTIPFPQRDVRVVVEDAAARARVEAEARVDALRRIPLLAAVDDATLEDLASKAETRLYAPSERVVVEGDAGDELFALSAGEVRVISGGSEIARLQEGDFFGEMSLLTGERRTATVVAVSACRLVVVGHAALQHAFDEHPELVVRLSAALAERQLALEAHRRGAPASALPPVQLRANELLSRIRAFFQT
jgi:small-conductance mechanosensitive channel/CRP-like cAMP-binding protein